MKPVTSQVMTAIIVAVFLLSLVVITLIPKTQGHICEQARQIYISGSKDCFSCVDILSYQCAEAREALKNTLKHYCRRKRKARPCPEWSYCYKDLSSAIIQVNDAIARCKALSK